MGIYVQYVHTYSNLHMHHPHYDMNSWPEIMYITYMECLFCTSWIQVLHAPISWHSTLIDSAAPYLWYIPFWIIHYIYIPHILGTLFLDLALQYLVWLATARKLLSASAPILYIYINAAGFFWTFHVACLRSCQRQNTRLIFFLGWCSAAGARLFASKA